MTLQEYVDNWEGYSQEEIVNILRWKKAFGRRCSAKYCILAEDANRDLKTWNVLVRKDSIVKYTKECDAMFWGLYNKIDLPENLKQFISDFEKIFACKTPGDAKRLGRNVALKDDWEKMKCQVMLDVLRAKFRDKRLRKKLLETDEAVLIEGNTWNDREWGKVNHVGRNKLGKLLMYLRTEIELGL